MRLRRIARVATWVKVKCVKRQELVIGGFTEPEGARAGVGAVLVGYYEGEALKYSGKVGTGKGFTREYLTALRVQLDAIEQPACPFEAKPKSMKIATTHWVKPELVVEVQFLLGWVESVLLFVPVLGASAHLTACSDDNRLPLTAAIQAT